MLFKKSLLKFKNTKYITTMSGTTKKFQSTKRSYTVYPPIKTGGKSEGEAVKDYKDWSDKDLRNELKRHGKEYSENVEKSELIENLKEINNKDMNKRGEQRRSYGTTATMGQSGQMSGDYGNWSIKDLVKELKKFGQNVSENMQKSELIQKLKDLSSKDSNKTHSSYNSNAQNMQRASTQYSKTETHPDTDFSKWSTNDLRSEMKKYGQDVKGDMKKEDMIKKLEESNKSNIHAKSNLRQGSKNNTDFNSWSISELRDEMKNRGQKLSDNIQKSEMVQKLRELDSESRSDIDYNSWSATDLVQELKKFGQDVSEKVEKSELVQKMKDLYKDKIQSSSSSSSSANNETDFNSWSITDLTEGLKKFGHNVSENIQKSELVQKMKEFYVDKIQPSKNFEDMTMGDLKNEMVRIGHEVSESMQKTEMVQKLKDFYADKIKSSPTMKDFERMNFNDLKEEMVRIGHEVSESMQKSEMVQKLKEFYADKIQPTANKVRDFENWSLTDLKEEMKKMGQEVGENIQKSDLVQRLKDLTKDDIHPSQIDYNTWSISDLTEGLKKFGHNVSENIQKSELVQKMKEFASKDSDKSSSSSMNTSSQKDYSNWSINDLRDEMKKLGHKVSENIQKSEIIQKLNDLNKKDSNKMRDNIQKSSSSQNNKESSSSKSQSYQSTHATNSTSNQTASSMNSQFTSDRTSGQSQSSSNIKTSQSSSQKDYSNWSIGDLRDEMKKMGQKVNDQIQKSDMIQKLKDCRSKDSSSKDSSSKDSNSNKSQSSDQNFQSSNQSSGQSFNRTSTRPSTTSSPFTSSTSSTQPSSYSLQDFTQSAKQNIDHTGKIDRLPKTNQHAFSPLSESDKKINNYEKEEKSSFKSNSNKDSNMQSSSSYNDNHSTSSSKSSNQPGTSHASNPHSPSTGKDDVIKKYEQNNKSSSKTDTSSPSSMNPTTSKSNNNDLNMQSSSKTSSTLYTSSSTQKDYSNWSINDLRDELKKFGQTVSENIQKSELIQKLKDFSSKDSSNSNIFSQRRSYGTTATMGQSGQMSGDYSNWSIKDLMNEMKKFGQTVSENMQKSEMIQKLKDFSSKSQSSTSSKQSSSHQPNTPTYQTSQVGTDKSSERDRTHGQQNIHSNFSEAVINERSEQSNPPAPSKNIYQSTQDRNQPPTQTEAMQSPTMERSTSQAFKQGFNENMSTSQQEMTYQSKQTSQPSSQNIKSSSKQSSQPSSSSYSTSKTGTQPPQSTQNIRSQHEAERFTQSNQTMNSTQTGTQRDHISQVQQQKDHSEWSENALRDELKRQGQRVSETMQKSEMIQKLNDLKK